MLIRPTPVSLSIAGVLAGLMLVAAPAAHAAEHSLSDPARDNQHPGLDLLDVETNNGDYATTVTVDYRTHRSGTTVVGLKARERGLLRIVNVHDRNGPDRTLLLNNAGRVACEGLRAMWDADDAELTVAIPSICLWQGNYGAVRSWCCPRA